MKYSVHCRTCGARFSTEIVCVCRHCQSDQLQAIRDPNEVRRERDLKTMKGLLPWPCQEILPLMKTVKQPRKADAASSTPGILIRGRGPTVIFSSMFDLIQAPGKADTANSKTYPSYEAIIEDGWRVD